MSDAPAEGGSGAVEQQAAISCRVFSSFDEIDAMEDEWDGFVEEVGGDIYGTFGWCRTWWEFYGSGRRLEIYLARQGERLVGIFPLFRETLWYGVIPLRVIRLVGCDHTIVTCNVMMEPGIEQEVIAAFARALEESGAWDVVHFGPLPGYTGNWEVLAGAFQRHFEGTRIETNSDVDVQTIYDLPGSFEEYEADMTGRRRRKNRRYGRRLREAFRITERVARSVPESLDAFEGFVELHQALWRSRGKLGHFADWPRAIGFHRKLVERLASRGRLFLMLMEADGAAVEGSYGFLFGGRLHTFLTARDGRVEWQKWCLGRVGFLKAVESAIGSGVRLIDFGRGAYEYKLEQGGRVIHVNAITVTRCGLRARAGLFLLRCVGRILHLGYCRLWFARIAPRLGLLRGPLWESWIRTRL